jgi:hypothetical protein
MRFARRSFGLAAESACRGFRFHDLRHTGQNLAASTGATTKDLMRIGLVSFEHKGTEHRPGPPPRAK